MSDIQAKIAARRAELDREEKEKIASQAAAKIEQQAEQQLQERAALGNIATDLSVDGVTVQLEGDELAIIDAPLPSLDVEGLKQSKIKNLLAREARKRWTPRENWAVITCIVSGIWLMLLGPGFVLGFLPLLFGIWQGSEINKKHRTAVKEAYPSIFEVS